MLCHCYHHVSEQDALAAHRERLEIELEGRNRVLEAERLEAGQMCVKSSGPLQTVVPFCQEEQEIVARAADQLTLL